MKAIIYYSLTEDAKEIRKRVFVEEQGFQNEFDEIDQISKHIVLFDENQAVATCRVFWNEKEQCYHIGRVAVLKEYRGQGIGEQVMLAAQRCIQDLGGKEIELSGQVRVASFYEKMGYQKQGEEYLDEGCPHVKLRKQLEE